MTMTAHEAIAKMWRIADKPERMRCFHKIVFDLPDNLEGEVFWHEFWRIWETSENLNEDEDYIPALVEYGLDLGDPHSAMEDDEKAAFEAMPDEIVIYRGAIAELNEDGWSWTTDRAKAHWFAKRGFGGEERVVLKATVAKANVLAYLTGRNESEIVVDPDNVENVEIDESFYVEEDPKAALFYAIQSGRLDQVTGGGDMDKVRAAMMANTMSGPLEGTIAEIENTLEFIRWADLRQKRGYMEALLEILQKKQADPNFEPLEGFSM